MNTTAAGDPLPRGRSAALDKALAARRAMRDAGIVTVTLDPVQRAQRNPGSLRLAINGKCWDCVGGSCDTAPRQRIRDCRIIECTLHPVRPYQDVKGRSGPEIDSQEAALG
ncbi:MAG: hypothetical protein ACOY42_02060 [Pseudomonadota bacterium]